MLRRSHRVARRRRRSRLTVLADARAAAQDKFKLGMAVGGNTCCEWMKAQGDVARALAEKRGWDYVELSNNNDPATALKNAQIFVQEGVDAVIQFNGQPSVEPGDRPGHEAPRASRSSPTTSPSRACTSSASTISRPASPAARGSARSSRRSGTASPTSVISAEGAAAGIVNEWRTGGMRTGLKNICPDIPAEKWVSLREPGRCCGRLPAARDLLAAHPDAVKMAVVGLNDGGVLGADPGCRAARPRRRGDRLGPGRRLHHRRQRQSAPRGSVFYFLEGYAVYAFRDVIEPIADGQAAAAQGRCRRSRVAGRAVPGDGRSRPRRCRTCRSG